MLGKFEEGQKYGFYVGLTDRILDLVRTIKARRPHALNYRGMDLSHAFESQLYFGTVLDAALNELYDTAAQGLPPGQGAPLETRLAELMAAHWFGVEYAQVRRKRESSLHAVFWGALRVAHWLGAPFAARPLKAQGAMPPRCDVLLYARSTRFAEYLTPIARALPGRCAFLVPAGAHDVQRALAAAEEPFISAAAAGPRLRPFGSFVGWYAPQLGFFADGIESALSRARPRVVLVPEGNSPDDEVINQVGRKLGIPVVCLQQGWSPIIHPGFCNLSYDSMMVWGLGFADLLAPHNPLQRFVATGNHMLTSEFRDLATKSPGIIFFHQDLDRGLGGRRGSDMMLLLAERVAEARPEVPIHVRPHPLVPLDEGAVARLSRWPNVTVQRTADVPLAQALNAATISVSIYSTTILESIAAGTVPLIFNMTSLPRFWPDVAAEGAGVEVHTLDEAFDALMRLLSDGQNLSDFTPAMAEFAQRYFFARGPKAVENIVAELDRLVRCGT